MPSVEGSVVIDRPVEEVFDFVADERNVYDPRIVSAEKLTPGPIGAGTRFRCETESRGRSVPMRIEIISYERPWHLATTTKLSSLKIDSTASLESIEEGTRIRWHWNVRPLGVMRLLSPLLGRISRRQAQIVWGSLKRALEER